uniref:Uncharacterized protein n=1 Tax=Clytia hemisphaerica TaxID=252671 RepID=A0A7M5WSM2_9CNID
MSDKEEVFCVCKKPYEDGQFMIECGKCNGWFHGSCVGIEEYQAADIDIYVCPKCQPKHGPLVLKKRRNIARHNYKEIHEGTKQITAGTVMFVRQLKARKFKEPTEDVLTTLPDGTELNGKFLHENGFDKPMVIQEKSGLGITVPPPNFTIYDVEKRVGSMHELHVIDVARQEDLRMKMREWTEYYNSPVRGKVLNVISLEFSKTNMAELVEAPEIVRNISWVDNAWPKEKNSEDPHTKPIVAKYCLMSVKDCYTDFHVDFGGTSVWYHIVRGEKIFYFIEPTEENLKKYAQWVSSSDQGQVFFGEKVDKCYKVRLTQGNTLILPTGWIHAVLTPKDSLVFGGNFLHSYNIALQLRIYELEKSLHTPLKFLFPNFETTNWFAARSILRKIREIHQGGYRLPIFLYKGVETMLLAFRKWTKKQDEFAKFHKLQIPLEMNAQKLMKSLEKELKMDIKMLKDFNTEELLSPAVYGSELVVNKPNIIRLKFNRTTRNRASAAESQSNSSEVSSPEKLDHAKGLERLKKKRDKLKKMKEELENKRTLPSIKLNLKEGGSVSVKKYEEDDDELDVTEPRQSKPTTGIKLKLSLSQPSKNNDNEIKTEGFSSSTEDLTLEDRLPIPVARLHKKNPLDLKKEIEAAKKDIFSSALSNNTTPGGGGGGGNSLYFTPKEEEGNDITVRPVSFNPDQQDRVNPSNNFGNGDSEELFEHSTELEEEEEEVEDNDGYVIDFLPKPKGKPERQNKHRSSQSDSDYDYNPISEDEGEEEDEDNYYEDADFVYPRVDVDSELYGDDFSWNPNNRKPPKRKRTRKPSGVTPSASSTSATTMTTIKKLKEDDFDPFFAPDEDVKKPAQRNRSTSSTSDGRQKSVKSNLVGGLGPSSKAPIKKKPKTSTTKQRLGKLLKLDKTGTRYVR